VPSPSTELRPHASWIIHCDGSALPNPGRMGLGAVIVAPDGTRQTLSHDTHRIGCNNEAELRAVMAAMRSVPSSVNDVIVYSDNSIVVAQLTQNDAPPIARLADLFDEARAMLANFKTCDVRWVPRHRNLDADTLARAALGMPPKSLTKPTGLRRQR
jgi:ribonuclease HI